MKNLFEHIIGQTPDDSAKFIDKSMDIADQIVAILKAKGWTQKDLADKLDKSESEISKWLTGTHNFTLRSLTKIEAVLKEDVIIAPMYWEEYEGMYATENAQVNVKPLYVPHPHTLEISKKPIQQASFSQDDFKDIAPQQEAMLNGHSLAVDEPFLAEAG